MNKLLLVMVIWLMIALPLIAQDKEDEPVERSYSYWNKTKIGGAGGVTPIVGMFDNKGIDAYLTAAGLPALGSDPIYIIGGEGYGYIMFLKNVRMGGFGGGGMRSVSKFDAVANVRKEVEYSLSYGGFLIDYVQPIAYKLDLAVGASIGGGSVDITMRRDDGSFKDWDSLWSQYGDPARLTSNYTRKINGAYVVVNPHVNIEYTLLTWLQIRVGVGYPIMFSPEWKVDDKFELNSVPSKITPKGYTINAGIMFGFFGW
jgi:hypothetical protein